MMKCLLAVSAVLLLNTAAALADPRQLEVFTSFEPPDTGPVFGSQPVSATFSGGSARIVGNPSLYHTGSFSWEVPAGVTTVVQFSGLAETVEFFSLDTCTINASVAAFDANEGQIGELFLTGSFSSPPGNFSNPLQFTGAIAKLEFRNPGSGSAWIDDFGFSPLPEVVLPGDYNQNDVVDAADYGVWRDSLGQTGSGLAADGSGNNLVDTDDYNVWRSHFGQTAGSGSGAANIANAGAVVPEPATLISAAVAVLAWAFPRRANQIGRIGSDGTIAEAWG